ncbi:lantibiotic ABC transporter permease [Parasporobacterium paucivorans]|uniref:TspO and MBR related proteins n=1 Tax=Parasporobacterium paucivorans DSM 15970 TaxID=1122934 RepID=A0A1M6DKR5_9FIRM|nr:lantibiotic ABC transporter permease [Parasporobacterium paucivorans]SHI73792.1 hypothetical protein SAMN02745691_00741 [Parasporobacterium paucivorans DSM 15970]
MSGKVNITMLKVITAVTFLVMVIVNALANALPLNGITTGAVSDSYPNLFAPAGLTFAIWGVIYLFLAMYTVYQFELFGVVKNPEVGSLMSRIGIFYSISSVANTVWIFAWHFKQIQFSMFLMAIILICLIVINMMTRNKEFSNIEKIFIRIPFSVYFGWITVATIANATTLLVSLEPKDYGLPESVWAIIILLVGMLIGCAAMIVNKDIAYGLVLIWAYFGILIKHVSSSGFAGRYLSVITVVVICIVLFIVAELYTLVSILKKKKIFKG